jgi:hypothetical protein
LQRRTLHHEHHTNKNKNPPLGSSHAVTIAVTDDPMMLCSKPVLQRAAPDATSIACQVTVVTAPDLRQPQVYPSWRRDNDGELHHGRHLYNWPLILLYYFLFSCRAIGVNAETAMPSMYSWVDDLPAWCDRSEPVAIALQGAEWIRIIYGEL